jgi:hypothetical protein
MNTSLVLAHNDVRARPVRSEHRSLSLSLSLSPSLYLLAPQNGSLTRNEPQIVALRGDSVRYTAVPLTSTDSSSTSILPATRDHGVCVASPSTGLGAGPWRPRYGLGHCSVPRPVRSPATCSSVIGDSQVILRHLDGTNRVTEPNLAHVVRRTQTALRRLGTYKLRHTLPTGNKMADALADSAMDQQHSSTGPDGTDTTT